MFSAFLKRAVARGVGAALLAALLLLSFASAGLATAAEPPATQPAERVLRIACDPNNLPFSNDRLEGFENKIAELVAHDLNAKIEYTWMAQRRSFFRETIKEGDSDMVLGCPSNFQRALPTIPYYRSTYVFVTRKDRDLNIDGFDNPLLRTLKVGVQVMGTPNTPPAIALGRRGIADNVTGFTLYADYAKPNPPARIIDAVANGEIDVAIAWGPMASYFASREPSALRVTPVAAQIDAPALAMAFDVSMGVRKKNVALRDELNQVLQRRKPEIDRILDEYGVPRVPQMSAVAPTTPPAQASARK